MIRLISWLIFLMLLSLVAVPPLSRERLTRLRPELVKIVKADTAGQSAPNVISTKAVTARSSILVIAGAVAGVLATGELVFATLGAALGLSLAVLQRRRVTIPDKERRAELSRQAPMCADLLVSCLLAGATLERALGLVAANMPEPAHSELRQVCAQVDLGAPLAAILATQQESPLLAPIAAALVRSSHSGSSLVQVLDHAAREVRRTQRSEAEVAAKKLGVQMAGPLAACFLPAFLLVGVIPTVASLVGTLLAEL